MRTARSRYLDLTHPDAFLPDKVRKPKAAKGKGKGKGGKGKGKTGKADHWADVI